MTGLLTPNSQFVYWPVPALGAGTLAIDWCFAAIFMVVANRPDLLPGALWPGLVFSVAIIIAAFIWFQLLARRLDRSEALSDALTRFSRKLPALVFTAAWLYYMAVFATGLYAPLPGPESEAMAPPQHMLGISLIWYALVYAAFMAAYAYVLSHMAAIALRDKLQAHLGMGLKPGTGRISHKILVGLVILVVLPAIVITSDLTVFADVRYWQGIDPLGTILIDLGGLIPVATLLFLFLARVVDTSVRRLLYTIDEVENSGHLATAPILSDDEFGVLADRFNKMTARIIEEANTDAPTGLANRRALSNSLKGRFSRGAPTSLILIRVTNLPEINMTLGHGAGDQVLLKAAWHIKAALDEDVASLYRFADETLALLVPGADIQTAETTARRLRAAFHVPIRTRNLPLHLRPAFGIAHFPDHGETIETLQRNAEIALRHAGTTADPIAVFNESIDHFHPDKLRRISELKDALTSGHMRLDYQPKLNLHTMSFTGAEGLIRWQHPTDGLISPGEFIPLAEKSGEISAITRWAVLSAARTHKALCKRHTPLTLAVNVSARDLNNSEFLPHVEACLKDTKAIPGSLVFEITESAVIENQTRARDALTTLRSFGIGLSIDDFGVGQASMAYLRDLSVDELKIDRSFITNLHEDHQNQCIVRSLISLGHDLGLKVTAEGVERKSELALLKQMGCDTAQGFYIARPAPLFSWIDRIPGNGRRKRPTMTAEKSKKAKAAE